MTDQYIRLYISPFDPALHDRLIPASLKEQVKDTTFHSIQTFPEKGFGYVNLPFAEAQKLRAKLNGMTLRGHKLRVEEAKPRKIAGPAESDGTREEMAKKSESSKGKKSKKVREQGVLPGYELEQGRRVKRGWSEVDQDDGQKSKKRKKSKETVPSDSGKLEDKRLEFRTKPPANATAKKSDEKKKERKKDRSKVKEGQVIVKEFSQSREVADAGKSASQAKRSEGYDSDTGWADEDGNIVEGPSTSKRPKQLQQKAAAPRVTQTKKRQPSLSTSSESESTSISASSEDSDSESDSESSDSDSESEPDSEKESDTASTSERQTSEQKAKDIADPGNKDPAKAEVHPLEALFKRAPAPTSTEPAKHKPAPIDTSFSFFAAETADDNDATGEDNGGKDSGVAIPQTPHTKRDLEWRGVRSAAPTPDTAAIGKRFSFGLTQEDDEDEDEDSDDDDDDDDSGADETPGRKSAEASHAGASGSDGARGEESAFRKWFYENRGDFNRGWKKRRREERKLQRKRENQRLSRKIA